MTAHPIPLKWPQIPLAEAMRPKRLSHVVGQAHLLGAGKPLAHVLNSKQAHSMILWGPPGVGKTTLARLIAHEVEGDLIAISAVLAGVKDIRQAVDQAQNALTHHGKRSLLFVDEIHRFNKSQQDALLPFVESGLLTFIGATTENPSFEVNSALLSRAQTYVLKTLEPQDMYQLLERVEQIITQPFVLDATAQEILIHYADGDARRFLNATVQVIQASFFEEKTTIDADFVQNILAQYRRRFDKGGEQFYDQISALHKAVRGSHPDAALYWLCRMLDGGVDPLYLARRIVRMAWEDIGLADPRAIQIALDATATFERLGSPEGELALGEAVIYLALAAKSNAAYQAYQQAKNFVAKDQSQEVPLHLRNAPTQLMKNLDYGASYRYAHDEPHGYAAAESYLPLHMQEPGWYQPSDRGLEIQIKEKMAFLKKLDQGHKKDSNP